MTSASDDFSWFWAGESGRDQLLRNSVEDLNAQLSASSRQSSRLSSQLTALRGSMESRLSALSIAFDAYVELGDIREQLAGYPDTSQIRREVRDAITAVGEGRTASPIDDRGLAYWLPHATNAVLAIAAGSSDHEAGETARSLSPDSELFIVAAAAAVGHGPAVADRLPLLLISDGTLSSTQIALWRAACDGAYGDPVAVLASIRPQWQQAVDAVEPVEWTEWVRKSSAQSPRALADWIRGHSKAASAVPEKSGEGQGLGEPGAAGEGETVHPERAGLKEIVADLAGQGIGDEATLLRRARALRARIEKPTAEVAAQEAPVEPPRVPVVDVIRQTLADHEVGSPAHDVVLGWLTPALLGVLEAAEADAARPRDFVESVSSGAGSIEVSAKGAEPAELADRTHRLRTMRQSSPVALYAFAAAAALTLIVGIVLLAVGSTGGGAMFLVLAAIGVIGVLYQLYHRRIRSQEAEDTVRRFHTAVEEARATADRDEQKWRDELDKTRRVAWTARDELEQAAAGRSSALR